MSLSPQQVTKTVWMQDGRAYDTAADAAHDWLARAITAMLPINNTQQMETAIAALRAALADHTPGARAAFQAYLDATTP